MRNQVFFSILIFVLIFHEGLATLTENSSDLLIRHKRLIDRSSHNGRSVKIEEVPYIVNIMQDGMSICGGCILAPNIVLSTAHCFLDRNVTYRILSGSRYINRGLVHKIMRKLVYPDFKEHLLANDLAVLIISPHIDLVHSRNRGISLYNGVVRPNTLGTFSGWGCNDITENTFCRPLELQSFTVPIISQEECQNSYQNMTVITNKDICTLDANREKCCSFGDCGGPLVIDRRLVGIMVWSRVKYIIAEHPDVFVSLLYRPYRNWLLLIMHEFKV